MGPGGGRMCRLFGMSAAPHRVRATFWLLDARDSLAVQSRREPDGTGLGAFDTDGSPRVDRRPLAAYRDRAFASEARDWASTVFVAHVRYASTGAVTRENTHPFVQRGRIFAHNGVISDLPALEAALGGYRELVAGDTDSERFFALITRYVDEHGGDVGAGIASAARWIAEHLPLYSLNLVLAAGGELWALRYPDNHDLLVLRRAAGGPYGDRHLEHASRAGTLRARSADLAGYPTVVVATERMDEDPGWQHLRSGELLHVDSQLAVSRQLVLDAPPRHPFDLADLDSHAAGSQER